MLSSLFIIFYVVFLSYVLSVTVLRLWVAPPILFCNWYRIYWCQNQLWNCTHCRHLTEEQLRISDIVRSNIYLQSAPFESINQSINQSVSQSVSQSISQSANQSINQSNNLSVSQSTSQSVNQSVSNRSWSVGRSVGRSVSRSVRETGDIRRYTWTKVFCSILFDFIPYLQQATATSFHFLIRIRRNRGVKS